MENLQEQYGFSEEEMEVIKDAYLLTIKPILYIANISEEQMQSQDVDERINEVREYAKS